VKNRDYWRYELERESAINKRRPRMFVGTNAGRASFGKATLRELWCHVRLTADQMSSPSSRGRHRTAPRALPFMQLAAWPQLFELTTRLPAQSGQALLNAASMLLGTSSVEETRWQSRRLRRVVELLRQGRHDPRLAGKR
jgi:hypothetical protein